MFPDSCRREHSSLPYKWEVKEGSEWKALPDNEAIEKDYCNPARTYRCVKENTWIVRNEITGLVLFAQHSARTLEVVARVLLC